MVRRETTKCNPEMTLPFLHYEKAFHCFLRSNLWRIIDIKGFPRKRGA
jgi:hypothetical protein